VRERNDAKAARQAEAARFAAEVRLPWSLYALPFALEKIEVAVALDPENLNHRTLLYYLRSDCLIARLTNPDSRPFQYDSTLRVNRLDAEATRQAIQDSWCREAMLESLPND